MSDAPQGPMALLESLLGGLNVDALVSAAGSIQSSLDAARAVADALEAEARSPGGDVCVRADGAGRLVRLTLTDALFETGDAARIGATAVETANRAITSARAAAEASVSASAAQAPGLKSLFGDAP
jgi:DNA-binding protein YbaB